MKPDNTFIFRTKVSYTVPIIPKIYSKLERAKTYLIGSKITLNRKRIEIKIIFLFFLVVVILSTNQFFNIKIKNLIVDIEADHYKIMIYSIGVLPHLQNLK